MRGRAERGFTLVELLVALVILGLLSVLLHAGLRDGARSWRAVDGHAGALELVAATQGFLRERLAGIGRGEGAVPGPAARLAGSDERLVAIVPWLSGLPDAGLYRLELAAVPDGQGGRALVLDWRPAVAGAAPGRLAAARLAGERTLLTGLGALSFRYFGATGPGETAAWHPRWPAGAPPPRLLRIDAAFADPALRWPPLVIALP